MRAVSDTILMCHSPCCRIWDYLIAGSVPFHLTFAASIVCVGVVQIRNCLVCSHTPCAPHRQVLTCKPQLMKRKKGTDVCKILFQVLLLLSLLLGGVWSCPCPYSLSIPPSRTADSCR